MGLVWIFGILLLMFGFSVSAYFTYFKLPIRSVIFQTFAFLGLGLLTTGLTLAISISLIWIHP